MNKLLLLLPLIFASWDVTALEDRGLHRIKLEASTQAGDKISLYKESHALLIGVSEYTQWPRLDSIPGELDEVEQALKSQNFNVIRLRNPKGRELSDGIENFIDEYGYEPENRLLIYFSGHGHSIGHKGLLIPADTPLPEDEGFRRKSVPMSRVLSWARDMEAKHALFIFDSCFSGTIFKSRSLPKKDERYIRKATAEPVRQFITAGSANEEVPAKSTFTPALVRAIRGEGDLNKDGYITGSELGVHLSQLVPRFVDQTPQYGKIKDYDLAQGDFVFFTGDDRPPETASVTIEAMLWQSAERGSTIDDYAAYLEKYPKGTFARIARTRIEQLKRNRDVQLANNPTLVPSFDFPPPDEQESKKALSLYHACTRGELTACTKLGNMFENGRTDEMKLATKSYRQVCNSGDKNECAYLAGLLKGKLDVKKDDERAATLYKAACDREEFDGCSFLGRMYERGYGVERDKHRAAELYKTACNGGSADGCINLAYVYRHDTDRAVDLLSQYCNEDSVKGCGSLGYYHYESRGNVKRAIEIYRRACEGGDAEVCDSLATSYSVGRPVDVDHEESTRFYRRACDLGRAESCESLGYQFARGLGVEKNEELAFELYKRSCNQGSLDGCFSLALAYSGELGEAFKDEVRESELVRELCARGVGTACDW